MGLIDDEEIHENCMMEVNNLNQQIISIQNESTQTNLEKNRLETLVHKLRAELQNLKSSHSNISVS